MTTLRITRLAQLIASRGICGVARSAFHGIDIIIQPNGLQLSTVHRQPWTNDAQLNPRVPPRKCNSRRCAELPSRVRTSIAPPPSSNVEPKKAKDVRKPLAKGQVVLAPPIKDELKAAAAARERIRYFFLQSMRSHLAKI